MERFTAEQINEYHNAFCVYEMGRGYIPSSRLRNILKASGFNPTDEVLEKLLMVIDLDGNGRIDFTDFIDLIGNLDTAEKKENDARDAFSAFDSLGRGYVQSDELIDALMFITKNNSSTEQEGVVKHFNLLPNRNVYFEEFKNMVATQNVKN